MGANSFQATGTGPSVREAFDAATSQAGWEYGHGYSGTVAEKHSYVEWTLPAGRTVDEFTADVLGVWDEATLSYGDRPAWIPARIADIYGDKWGPAVAIRTGATEWTFVGMASS
jgi:hypothetical protein